MRVDTLRQATFDDVPALCAMAGRFMTGTQYGTVLGHIVGSALESFVVMVVHGGAAWVAEHDGRLVAMLGALDVTHPMNGERYIEEVCWWVDPPFRTGLLGPRMLGLLEAWATTKSVPVLKMVAPADNPAVAKFLERRGYTAVETIYRKDLSDGLEQHAGTAGVDGRADSSGPGIDR